MSLEDVRVGKSLKLWNGRIYNYEHGYIAARSVADAVRVAQEHLPLAQITPHEIKVYWHANAWGNRMIGITPERGLWAEKQKTREIVRIVHGKEIPVTRGPEWEQFQAKQKAELEAAAREQEREREEKQRRLCELHEFLLKTSGSEFVDHTLEQGVSAFWFRGHRYEIREVDWEE